MTRQGTDKQEQSHAQTIIRIKAVQLAKPVVLSLTDADTGELRATPTVAAIMADETFKNIYDSSAKTLKEIGTPSVPINPKRILAHLVEHNSSKLHIELSRAQNLAELFMTHAEAETITFSKAAERSTKFSPPAALPQHDRLAEIHDTPIKTRLELAKKVAHRVLFDREGNLKPNGILARPNIAPAFDAYKVKTQGEVGTSALMSEETLAGHFVETVLSDIDHTLIHTLREAILSVAKKLPDTSPERVPNSLSDAVRLKIADYSNTLPNR